MFFDDNIQWHIGGEEMPYEKGGRSDKNGNRYEIRVVVYYILKLLQEKIDYVILEAIGNDEQGIDLWIGHKDGFREGIQCKARNGSKEVWDFGTANAKNIFTNWKLQLDQDSSTYVSLASPLAFTFLEDLIDRAIKSNNNGYDFYEYQIKSSSKEFVSFTNNICRVMEIDYKSNHDLRRLIGYLKRIRYHQRSDYELKDIILSIIDYMFLGKSKDVYDSIVTWIIDGDMLGKRINLTMLYQFLEDNKLKLKNLALDNRIIPRIEDLNREYKMLFQPLNYGMIIREEFKECRESIKAGESLIIHGKAGRGKSGCTENIISYCEEEGVRYLAIKLDKRIPTGTSEKWGIDLGFPASIVHCIHSIAKNERAVIILDQLDALRWTQAHSRDALLVCSQIIEQVKILNLEREHKISMVFVCRTYDLENDNNIKGIFMFKNKGQNELEWQKVYIGELGEDLVKDVIGEKYLGLTDKLRELLRSPSNLYIWQHLDHKNEYNECSTTNHLVHKWWEQLSKNYFDLGHSESDLTNTKEKLVDKFDKLGRICIPLNIVPLNITDLKYLSSNGFLIMQDNKISFTHQSVLDCLLADKMLSQYYSGESIVDIMGSREKQTPGKRYQLQMFMQNLSEYNSLDFINAGRLLLESDTIRFSNKFVFFEVLNQIETVDLNISNFIIENCENKPWSSHIINNVIYSRIEFYRVLRDLGVLDRWFETEKKDTVLKLLTSIRPNYDLKDVQFIEKYAFNNEEDAYKFAQCFYIDLNEDSDEMFELRMQFYNKYPELVTNYFDFKSLFKNCDIRTIRFFVFLLNNNINNRNQIIHKYENELLHDDNKFLIENGEQVLKILLKLLPMESEKINGFSEWSGRYHKDSIQRVCINIIKKANTAIISYRPKIVWDLYMSVLGDHNELLNELLLDMFTKLPTSFSDCIITLICTDFNKYIFDKTSGNGDELRLFKDVIKNHGAVCAQSNFNKLESMVIYYVSPRATDIYKRRLDYNKQDNDNTVYWSYWGDLQYELLKALPIDRLSNQSNQLLKVLERKFPKGTQMYHYSYGSSGWIRSPISKKALSTKNWKGILTSKKLKSRNETSWKGVSGGFIESSLEEFSKSFNSAVKENPENMLKLVLSLEKSINHVYIDELFNGIAYSDSLGNVNPKFIEQAILRYGYDYDSYRASSICTIIKKKRNTVWSPNIIDALLDIAINHRNPMLGVPNITNANDKEMKSFSMLFSNAINCVRGEAADTIGTLLWDYPHYFHQFKNTIECIVNDDNPAVRLSSMFILWPVYNIERNWAANKIIELIVDDYRFTGFRGMKDMFFQLYSEYRECIISIIEKCYKSEDEDLVKMGARCLAEMYIIKGEFVAEMADVETMSMMQAEEILMMVMLYFNKDEYNSLAKKVIYSFCNSELDLEMPISRLFYDDLIRLDRDEDFLVQVMNSKLSRGTIHAFTHYIEEESRSLMAFKDIIYAMSQSLVSGNINPKERTWGIDDSVSKLIIGLYDEVSSSQQYEHEEISKKCLDIWDLMFENQIGSARALSQEIMQR